MGVNVETLPGNAQAISGMDTVCQGYGGYQYSIPAISNATDYVWTLPPGAVISQGQGTNAVSVDFSGSALSGDITVAGSNMCGTGTASTAFIQVEICAGINENLLRSQVLIYPNPVHDLLTLSIQGMEQQLQIRITDVSGRQIHDQLLENLPSECTRQIDVSRFAKGVYLIKLTNGSRVFTGKFTID